MPTPPRLRRTKIICTIGPSSWDPHILTELGENGMNVARLNFSHGTREGHQEVIDRIRSYNASHEQQVATMLDTRGAEIRTGDVQDPILVKKGEKVVFSSTASAHAASGR